MNTGVSPPLRAKVKICGVTNWRDARLAIEEGADALGFNFYARSPRCIPVGVARRIVKRAQHEVDMVGVFVNDSAQDVEDLGAIVGLDVLQLHGEEPPGVVADLSESWEVWKAFRVRDGFQPSMLGKYDTCKAFLLDGFSPRARGGAGVTFNWKVARQAKQYGPIVLAGGLTADNVAEAIREAQPDWVDVSSGVEMRPGKKDPHKLRAFLRAARSAK